jgi:hypothetical protein
MAVTTRRTFLGAAAALGAAIVAPRLALAQDVATPAAPDSGATPSLLADLGLPEITITVTGEGMDLPADVTAGTVLLRGVNQTEGYAGIAFAQLPEGMTEDELRSALGPETGIPEWAHESVITGGLSLHPGASGEVAFVLGAGDWYVLNVGENSEIVSLTVSGELEEVAIPADVEVEMSHHDFAMPAAVATGPQIWRLTNVDPVLHHIVLFSFPRPVTEDEVLQAMMAADGMGTPPADLDVEQIGFIAESGLISIGQSNWLQFDLPAGVYAGVCFISDPGSDVPHIAQGMIDVFTVS